MHPWKIANELLQESRCCNSASALAAQVLDIGDVALDHFAVVLIERQLPEFLSGALAGGPQLFDQLFICSKHTGPLTAEGYNDCSSERSQINNTGWILFGG